MCCNIWYEADEPYYCNQNNIYYILSYFFWNFIPQTQMNKFPLGKCISSTTEVLIRLTLGSWCNGLGFPSPNLSCLKLLEEACYGGARTNYFNFHNTCVHLVELDLCPSFRERVRLCINMERLGYTNENHLVSCLIFTGHDNQIAT